MLHTQCAMMEIYVKIQMDIFRAIQTEISAAFLDLTGYHGDF
jgi:hypothetical protein